MSVLHKLVMIAGLLFVMWFTAFLAMPAIVGAFFQYADSIGSHQRIAALDAIQGDR